MKVAEYAIRLEGAMMSRMTLHVKLGVGFGTLPVILARLSALG